MDEITPWIIISLASLILSAFFSGMEMAFVTSDRVRVELDVNKGGTISRIINRFYRNADFFISTLLVGNNIVLVVYGIGTAKIIEPWLIKHLSNEAMVLVCQTLISTGIILFGGEFIPKTIFRVNPNSSLRLFALPMMLIYILLYPVSLFSSWLSRALMHICGIRNVQRVSSGLSVGDLNQYIERTIDDTEASHAAVENEVKLFHNALDFSSTHIRDCMIPRNEIVAVDIDETDSRRLVELFISSGRSKIIVYREDIDNILGYIHVSELFSDQDEWQSRLKDVIYAPETILADKMMRRMLAEKRSIAVVIDEFGGTAGMVTLEDLVEEIFGDIQDEHDKNGVVARRLSENTYEFSGRAEIEYINETFGLDLPEDDEYQTLAGYILNATGSIPEQGAVVELGSCRFEIIRKTATRLELIHLTVTE